MTDTDQAPRGGIDLRPDRPILKRLRIQRFRGLEDFTWHPRPGLNVLLGGGDVGKTTVLDAIALLLSPSNSVHVSEADFWRCETEDGFQIEGVFWFPDDSNVLDDLRTVPWPWGWNGEEPTVPDLDGDPDRRRDDEPVLVFRVRATSDFELSWEIVNPSEIADYLPVGVRRNIGLVWLEGDDRNDKDLRLVYGSALHRLLGDRSLKSRLAQDLSKQDIGEALLPEAQENLKYLDRAFVTRALPQHLGVGLAVGRGLSLNALIGLTAVEGGQRLPMTSWGAGTRRLSSLEIAAANQSGAPVTVVDEIERGLEPHRQRMLMRSLGEAGNQVFLTTHSPVVLSSAEEGSLWYLDADKRMGQLTADCARHAREDPEAFLAALTVVAEGATEVGFLRYLLDVALDGLMLERGVWVTDSGGHDNALALLEGLSKAGTRVAGFVDDEGRASGRWKTLEEAMGALLWQWEQGCLEQNVIPLVPEDRLLELVTDPEGELTGERLQTLRERLQTDEKDWATLQEAASDIHEAIADAASGVVPDRVDDKGQRKRFKSHARNWFKSEEGGQELAQKCSDLGVWSALEEQLMPFLNGIRDVVGLEPLSRIAEAEPTEG